MKRWVAFLLALVLVAAAVCLFLSRTWMWADVPRVVAGTLNTGPVIKCFSLPAQLEAEGGVKVVPDRNLSYSLIVEEVCVHAGEAVAAGQVLLRCAPGEELTQALQAAEQTMERARLSALQARQGTEASYEAYLAWETASNAVLQNPSDAALAAEEVDARVALEKACVDADAQARLSARLTAERKLEKAQTEWTALQALVERAQALTAPQDGYVVSLAGTVGDEIRTDETVATLSASRELSACASVTAEQAAYFATAQGLLDVQVSIGRVCVPAGQPFAAPRGEQALLCAPVEIPDAVPGTACTLEIQLASGDGWLLPRTAVETVQENRATFFALEKREGFFGPEDIAVRVEARVIDWDEENVLISATELSASTTIIVEHSAPLSDQQQVLIVPKLS